MICKNSSRASSYAAIIEVELASSGLEMHESQKQLSNHDDSGLDVVEIEGLLIETLPVDNAHRCLGRMLERGEIELQHRLTLAWGKYHQHRRWFTKQNVSVQLRLHFVYAVVAPTALIALTTLPLSSTLISDLGICQRKMLRHIIS